MNILDTKKLGIKGKGDYIFTFCDVSTKRAQFMEWKIEQLRNLRFKLPTFFRRQLDKYTRKYIGKFNSLFMTRQYKFQNIVPTVGRSQIAQALTGQLSTLAEIEINESALGTGATAVANGDTTLDTETFRKTIASLTFSSNIAYATAFYTTTDVNGTFFEHGLFINGTGAGDSGVLLSRVLLNAPTGIAKSAIETLTIDYSFTLT